MLNLFATANTLLCGRRFESTKDITMPYRGNISLRFPRNSDVKLLENLSLLILADGGSWTIYCIEFVSKPPQSAELISKWDDYATRVLMRWWYNIYNMMIQHTRIRLVPMYPDCLTWTHSVMSIFQNIEEIDFQFELEILIF